MWGYLLSQNKILILGLNMSQNICFRPKNRKKKKKPKGVRIMLIFFKMLVPGLVGLQSALFFSLITSPLFSLGQNVCLMNQTVSICQFLPIKTQKNVNKRQITANFVKMLVPGPVGPRSRHFLIFLTTDSDSSYKNTWNIGQGIQSDHYFHFLVSVTKPYVICT